MPTVDKVIVTNLSALKTKYGANWTRIQSAVDALIAKDLTRGLSSRLILLDDNAVMGALGGTAVVSPGSSHENKSAINAVVSTLHPTHLMILGAIDVVPHQNLTNPLYDNHMDFDPDPIAWGDLPYASRTAYDEQIDAFIPPILSVGRLPDITGGKDPAYLVGLLNTAKDYHCRPKSDYLPYMGLSEEEWLDSTRASLIADFGNAFTVHSIPPETSPWPVSLLHNRSHFINCHGLQSDSHFYGSSATVPSADALTATQLDDHLVEGTVVAAECCYGAQLYDPTPAGNHLGICNTYMRNAAYGYLGSSTITYFATPSPDDPTAPPPPDCADLICRYFFEKIMAGASLGQALLQARTQYIASKSPLSDKDLKTLAQFNLMGDPSLQPVCLGKPPVEGVVMEFTGQVVFQLFAKGTKSERMAVMLITKDHKYVLRRPGVHTLLDTTLHKLVEKRVRFEGILQGYTLFVTHSTIIPDE